MFYRPIFEAFFGKRFVFQQAAPSEEAAPAPEAAPEAETAQPGDSAEGEGAPEEPATREEVVASSAGERAELKEETDAARMEKTVVDYWEKNGVDGNSVECSDADKKYREAIESDRVAYALSLMLVNGKSPRAVYYDESNGRFKLGEITQQFTKDKGYSEYGFYYEGGEWREVDTGFGNYDDALGSNFLTAWPAIVAFHAGAGWDELKSGNVAALQENVATMCKYLKLAGVEINYSGAGVDVADRGLTDAKSLRKKYSRELVDDVVKAQGQTQPINIAETQKYKDYQFLIGSESEGDYQYRYFPDENVIVCLGIAGTEKSGRVYVIDPTNENVDWGVVDGTAIKRVNEDVEKRKYLSLWYGGMNENERKDVYMAVAPESIVGEEIENSENEGFFLDMTKQDVVVNFEYSPVNREGAEKALVAAFVTALEAKRTALGNKWSDTQIKKAAEVRAKKVIDEADGKLRSELKDAYDNYGFVSNEKFKFMYMSGGAVKPKGSLKTLLDSWKERAEGAVDEVEEKVEETLQETIAKAIKASGNENIDPAKVEEYLAEYGSLYGGDKKKAIEGYIKIMSMPFGLGALVLQFMGPIMKALKGSIGGLVDKAKAGGDKAAEAVADRVTGGKESEKPAPLLTADDVRKCPVGQTVTKDGKKEFPELSAELELPIGFAFEIGEIVLPEKSGRLHVTQNHYLKEGKHKNIKLLGGIKLPKGTKLSSIRVLKDKAATIADVSQAVSADGKYTGKKTGRVAGRSPETPTSSAPETQVASAEPEEAAPEAPETQVADAAPAESAPDTPEDQG